MDSRSGIFGLVGEYMSTLKRKLEELSNRVADLDEQWRSKSKRIKDWSMDRAFREGNSFFVQQVERVDDLSKEAEEILGHCSFLKGLTTHTTGCRKSSPLVTTKLVGHKGEETIREICDYLMEEEIVIIGVYGMAGVGKTAISMHVHNIVLENPSFDDVFWVTVPEEFSVCKLQDKIANAVGLDNLSKDGDMKRRASILNRHLKKKRAILILDDLWMHFDFEDVGIPVERGGIRLILTTRSLDVCHKMLCQKQIEIRPLYQQDDCWNLFLRKLCFGRDLPSELKKIASSILDKCRGLPLGIIEIATHMRGAKEVHEWKDLLQELENSMMELNVFKKLQLSYMKLGNLQVQQCFLHLILCFGDYDFKAEIIKKVLIESFIDEGLLNGMATRQELHNKGNTILDKIKKACLGFDIDREYQLVHPLIRDMALQKVTSTTHVVKVNMGLKEIPKDKFWTDHLEKVFLQSNDIKEIPYGISPNCPKLMRLSLNNNVSLKAIHESFFKHMKGLKVLDLSKTNITELPDTISHLESLETLLLRECKELHCIPCVRKLGSLKKLDLSACAMLEEVPEGMEMLANLTYLDLLGTEIKALPEGVLGKLVNLQYLVINYMMEEEVEIELTMVEGLYCSVSNVETFNACVRLVEQNSSQPYDLALSASGNYFFRDKHERRIIIKSCHSIAATVDGEIGGDGRALLPKNVQVLEVGRCSGLTSLCEVGPLNNLEELQIEEWEKLEKLGAVHFPHLRRLNITRCSKLKRLGSWLPHLQWFKIEGLEEVEGIDIKAHVIYNIEVCSCPKMKRVVEWTWPSTYYLNVKCIIIRNCEKLEEIIHKSIKTTCYVTKIEIEGCNNLQRVLMTDSTLVYIPYLQHVSVKECKGIEVIIDIDPDVASSSLNLTHLTLSNLPELKSICEGTVSCLSIEYIHIENCPKLKRLPQLDGELAYPPPRREHIWIDQLTWQSLEGDHSLFQPSLEDLATTYTCEVGVSNQRIVKCIGSCDSIAARVDGEISGDGRNPLPKDVQVLKVGGDSGVTRLSEAGPLENLEELEIEKCEKLDELGGIHFPHLQKLNITGCSNLKHLSVDGQGLPCLRWFKIEGFKELEGIDLVAPNLNYMEVWACPKLKRVVEWDWLDNRLRNLWSIGIFYCEKLEEIIGGAPKEGRFRLKNLIIRGCDNVKGLLLTHNMFMGNLRLKQITVENCRNIETIIVYAPDELASTNAVRVKGLTLRSLPKLKIICDQISCCEEIQFIEISDCPKLKGIPLRMRQRDEGLLSPPQSLGQILIDRQTWQALVWDDPLERMALEPIIKFISE